MVNYFFYFIFSEGKTPYFACFFKNAFLGSEVLAVLNALRFKYALS